MKVDRNLFALSGVLESIPDRITISGKTKGSLAAPLDIGNSSFDHYADEPDLVMLTGLNPFVVLSILSL